MIIQLKKKQIIPLPTHQKNIPRPLNEFFYTLYSSIFKNFI
jgi:hypothetical protein